MRPLQSEARALSSEPDRLPSLFGEGRRVRAPSVHAPSARHGLTQISQVHDDTNYTQSSATKSTNCRCQPA